MPIIAINPPLPARSHSSCTSLSSPGRRPRPCSFLPSVVCIAACETHCRLAAGHSCLPIARRSVAVELAVPATPNSCCPSNNASYPAASAGRHSLSNPFVYAAELNKARSRTSSLHAGTNTPPAPFHRLQIPHVNTRRPLHNTRYLEPPTRPLPRAIEAVPVQLISVRCS
jgi:hypothetical protein